MRNIYNFQNINDVEFEDLCLDIMQKKLNTQLRTFAKGKDGGIDITDFEKPHQILIQVKHYIGSAFSTLITSLKNEVSKVEKLNPKQYYLCITNKGLTSKNIDIIYAMFSNYMESTENIVTMNDINVFLQKEENIEIVRRHHKLWLYSSNILSEIYNNDVFIDCEVLLDDIEEEANYFVPTKAYYKSLDSLLHSRLLFLLGAPGVGKTITSKMLILYFATQGYQVRYTTNGDIGTIKKSLSLNKEIKEIILLDDCLGQHYFKMKESQEEELLSLLKFIKMRTNKIIILNSRVAIFNEAKARSQEFTKHIEKNRLRIYTIDMDEISLEEKARIFYNHLKYKSVPEDYMNNIKNKKNYQRIIRHPNYSPRIIEYTTLPHNYGQVGANEYSNYLISTLNNPFDVWHNEFEYRLDLPDRLFMLVLYSLTETDINDSVLESCINARLSEDKNIDFTKNSYHKILKRLNGSLLMINDNKQKKIGVINPSVNDYLKTIFFKNKLELVLIKKSIRHINQVFRCYGENEIWRRIDSLVKSHSIETIIFNSKNERNLIILSSLVFHKIEDDFYTAYIHECLISLKEVNKSTIVSETLFLRKQSTLQIIIGFLEEPLASFYKIRELFADEDFFEKFIDNLNLKLLSSFNHRIVSILIELEEDGYNITEQYEYLNTDIENRLAEYIKYIDISEYCDNEDVSTLIEENISYSEDGEPEVDKDSIISEIIDNVADSIKNDVEEMVDNFSHFNFKKVLDNVDCLDIDGEVDSYVDSAVDNYFMPDYDPDPFDSRYRPYDNSDVIDIIFDR